MRGGRGVLVGAVAALCVVGPATGAAGCTELGTTLAEAAAAGLPVVEQEVLASSLPLLPFSGRTVRATVRAWGDPGRAPTETRLEMQLLTFAGCRAPMEGWPGGRIAAAVEDSSGTLELVVLVDAPGGLTDAQAASLTAALGPPRLTPPAMGAWVGATAWAWWPVLAILAAVVGYGVLAFRLLARVARRAARRREAREAAAT